MTKAFFWDEVGAEVAAIEVAVPDGTTPRQALVLIDDAISQLGETQTTDRTVRQVGDVFVLDALFGRGKVTRAYFCPEGDASAAEDLARKELDRDLYEGDE